eukprot:EG_transcript_27365
MSRTRATAPLLGVAVRTDLWTALRSAAPEGLDGEAVQRFRQSLESAEALEAGPKMTGQELKELVMKKYGRAYDTRLCKRRDRYYVEIMWFHEGQKAFPLSPERFAQQLDAVAETLNEWRVQNQVRAGIAALRKRPILDTTGAKAVLVPLALPPDADTTGW